jgi:hypothetical protein
MVATSSVSRGKFDLAYYATKFIRAFGIIFGLSFVLDRLLFPASSRPAIVFTILLSLYLAWAVTWDFRSR